MSGSRLRLTWRNAVNPAQWAKLPIAAFIIDG
jgi:hypothetical protein